ncbi:MAG: MFS transporter [Hyphomicrobium sp.]|nr:MFS transporter [Hyphomicrobium sp.]
MTASPQGERTIENDRDSATSLAGLASGLDAPGVRFTYAMRVAQFYGALFLVYGVHVPFLPIWLDAQGLTPEEVALITSVPFLVRLVVTPSTALLADSLRNHRIVIVVLAWLGLFAVAGLGTMTEFWGFMLLSVPFALATMSVMPLLETIAIQGVKRYGLDYGRMRLWGSLTFIAIGLLGGRAIDTFGPEAAYWLLAGTTLVTAVAAHFLPSMEAGASPPVRTVRPSDLLGPEVRRLIASRVFLAFLVATSFCQAAHAMFYTFGSLHWQSQGISAAATGGLWSIGVMAEVLLFAVAGRRLKDFRPETLMVVGAAASVFRWIAMGFDPPFEALVLLQILHALTYGAIHLGAIQFIARVAPEGLQGTIQALYATFAIGAMLGLTTMASGPLYQAFKGQAYFAMACVSLVALVAALTVRHLSANSSEKSTS